MMAMTTNNSMSVNAGRVRREGMGLPPGGTVAEFIRNQFACPASISAGTRWVAIPGSKSAFDQQRHGFCDPAAVPVVLARGPVAVDARDLQFLQQRLRLLMMLAKTAIAQVDQPASATEVLGLAAQKGCDAVVFEVLLGAEDVAHAVAVR